MPSKLYCSKESVGGAIASFAIGYDEVLDPVLH